MTATETAGRDVDLHGLAKITGMSYYTLRDKVTRREIPFTRYGRYRGVRFTPTQVEQIRAMHEVLPATPTVPKPAPDPLSDTARVMRAVARLKRAA